MLVAKIEFRKNSKKYFFSYEGIDLKKDDYAIVETARGLEIGRVTDIGIECPANLVADIKPVLRLANNVDKAIAAKNLAEKPVVNAQIKKMINDGKYEMKLVDSEYTLDKSKLIIYFEADERIDFRQLVKDLANIYRTRIELRQIGSRDSAKLLGGLGSCGYIMCCNKFISEFENVSIKMAKNQNLSLNPQKISGTCGKLLCCLKYENEIYEELRKTMPDLNDIVILEEGEAKIIGIDILKQQVRVKTIEDEGFLTVDISQIKGYVHRKKKNNDNDSNE